MRLPENTLQVAKISKLLLLMEKGTLANFAGQSLDGINVSLDVSYLMMESCKMSWNSLSTCFCFCFNALSTLNRLFLTSGH